MDLKFFMNGIKAIVTDPEKAWDSIERENKPVSEVRNSLLLPLILLSSLATFAGSLIFTNSELPAAYSVLVAVRSFIVLYLTVYFTAVLFGEVTLPLDLGKNFNTSFNLVVFSFIPFLICQVLSGIFESLLFVNVMALYGLYIFWEGTEKFLNPSQYKKLPLLIAVIIIAIVVYIASNVLIKMIADRIFYALFA
jgi:hypothetical protein